MYRSSYAEHLDETPRECRARERRAFDLALDMLRAAEIAGPSSSDATNALHFVCSLWQVLIEDLVDPDNDLPDVLRADLVSIGLWTMKEADSIRFGRSANIRGLIEICSIVRDGLR